jgi:colanic acid/amylovoran biosynthesis glycosyltransferase
MKRKTIALYVGEVPPVSFLERLAMCLSQMEYRVLLMGTVRRKIVYDSPFLQVVGPSTGWTRYLFFLRYAFLLFVFQPKAKQKLDRMLRKEGRFTFSHRIKFYPVLYHQPDVFHLQWAKAVDEWLWVQEFGMQLVLSLRGAHINYSPIHDESLRISYEQNFPKVNGFHAVSIALATEAQKYGAPAARIKVVYSGLPLEQFPYRLKTTIGTPLKILSIGRTHWKKGYTHALDAMALLVNEGFSFHYNLLGVQPNEELLFQNHELQLQSLVSFTAAVPFAEVIQAIHQADVLLLPSVEEGIANVVLEAMALGTLVVSTDCGGMRKVITDGHNGFLVPVRNPAAMAAVLQRVSKLSTSDYQSLTLAARQTIEERFTEAQMVASMQQLYQSLTPLVCE